MGLNQSKAIHEAVLAEIDEAEKKAWDALGRYKFQMFGYWAAIWVRLNRIGEFKRPNPWKEIVRTARDRAPDEPSLAKHQACGCVICTCEDNEQCHGCGAKHCGGHAVGVFPLPVRYG